MNKRILLVLIFLFFAGSIYSLNIETWFLFKKGADFTPRVKGSEYSYGLTYSYDLYFKIFKKYVFDIEILELNDNNPNSSLYYTYHNSEYTPYFDHIHIIISFGGSYYFNPFSSFYISPGLKFGFYTIQSETQFFVDDYYKKEGEKFVPFDKSRAYSYPLAVELCININYKIPKTTIRVGGELSYIRNININFDMDNFNVLMFIGVDLLK